MGEIPTGDIRMVARDYFSILQKREWVLYGEMTKAGQLLAPYEVALAVIATEGMGREDNLRNRGRHFQRKVGHDGISVWGMSMMVERHPETLLWFPERTIFVRIGFKYEWWMEMSWIDNESFLHPYLGTGGFDRTRLNHGILSLTYIDTNDAGRVTRVVHLQADGDSGLPARQEVNLPRRRFGEESNDFIASRLELILSKLPLDLRS